MEHIVIRLKDGTDVMGILLNERDKGVDLGGACIIRYSMRETGYPAILLLKYCSVTRGFNVYFQREDIMQVFYDPVPTLIEYYDRTIKKIEKNYSNAYDGGSLDSLFDYDREYETVEELQKDEEIILAMAEKFSSNTTIQ